MLYLEKLEDWTLKVKSVYRSCSTA